MREHRGSIRRRRQRSTTTPRPPGERTPRGAPAPHLGRTPVVGNSLISEASCVARPMQCSGASNACVPDNATCAGAHDAGGGGSYGTRHE
jgi:hypothetical protein